MYGTVTLISTGLQGGNDTLGATVRYSCLDDRLLVYCSYLDDRLLIQCSCFDDK